MTKAKDLLQFAGSCDDLDIEKSQKDWKTMNNPFLDDRPLTNETLTELGFEKKGIKGMEYWQYEYADDNYLVAKRDPNYAVPYVCGIEYVDKPICKTVGSVKLLIEALKGDE